MNFTGPDAHPAAANDQDMYRTLDVITELGCTTHGERERFYWMLAT